MVSGRMSEAQRTYKKIDFLQGGEIVASFCKSCWLDFRIFTKSIILVISELLVNMQILSKFRGISLNLERDLYFSIISIFQYFLSIFQLFGFRNSIWMASMIGYWVGGTD